MVTFYQTHTSSTCNYIIASAWENEVLTGITIGSDDQLWTCTISDLKAPSGMELFTFTKLLKDMFLLDTSSMSIYKTEDCIKIDCNHSADGLTFTLASFKAEPINGALSFYQNSIIALIGDNVQKTVSLQFNKNLEDCNQSRK